MLRCPSRTDLQELLAERLAAEQERPLLAHVETCRLRTRLRRRRCCAAGWAPPREGLVLACAEGRVAEMAPGRSHRVSGWPGDRRQAGRGRGHAARVGPAWSSSGEPARSSL